MSSTFVNPPQPIFIDWGPKADIPLREMLEDVTFDDFIRAAVELVKEGEYVAALAAIAIITAGMVAAGVEALCDLVITVLEGL